MRNRSEAGFTLLEMLVVIAILGIVGTVVLSRGPARSARADVRATTSILSGALRLARSQAIATDRPVAFVLNPAARSWRVGSDAPRRLPGTASVAGSVVVFAPEGSSSGGRIEVESGPVHAALGVDWLTGRVSVAGAR